MKEGIVNAIRHFANEDCEVTLNVSKLTEGRVILESVEIEPVQEVEEEKQ